MATAALLGGAVIVSTALITAAALGKFVPSEVVIDGTYACLLVAVGLVFTVLATAAPIVRRAGLLVASQLAAF